MNGREEWRERVRDIRATSATWRWWWSMLHSQIWVREMYIGNPEIYKIGSGTKLFITFLSLKFFDMRRERHNSFNKRAAHFVDPNWSRRGDYLPLDSNLNCFFFQIPKSSALPGMTSFTSPNPFLSGVVIVTSLSHPLRCSSYWKSFIYAEGLYSRIQLHVYTYEYMRKDNQTQWRLQWTNEYTSI